MEHDSYVALGIFLIGTCYLILIYNGLLTLKDTVSKAWENAEIPLIKRHTEALSLIETCKQYMDYEEYALAKLLETLDLSVNAIHHCDITLIGKAESQLSSSLRKLFMTIENSSLKSHSAFQQHHSSLLHLENLISERKQFYNDAANVNNIRITQFPDIIVAKLFAFRDLKRLEFSDNHEEKIGDIPLTGLFH